MKPKSAKQKGKNFEDLVAHEIQQAGLGQARREIGSGSGLRKGDIACNLPFLIECKNQKSLQWWPSIDQAKRQAEQGNYSPEKWALAIKRPQKTEVAIVMDFWEWLTLLKKNQEPKIKMPDREVAWKVRKLVQTAKAVLKELEQ